VEGFELTEGFQNLPQQFESWVSFDRVVTPVKEDGDDELGLEI
jgi:hypothetical protein